MTNVAFPTEDYRTVAVLRIAPWNLNPLRLVSFVEMIGFYKQYFDFEMHFIDHWKRRFAQRERERGPFDPLSEEERKEFEEWLARVEEELKRYELEWACERIRRMRFLLDPKYNTPTLLRMFYELEFLEQSIYSQFDEARFAYVPEGRQKYFENPAVFGEEVSSKFPSASADIQDAGNCYALGINVACVFYLMRIAERGLRALAKERRCRFKTSLDFQEWGTLIGEIEKKVSPIDQWPRGPKKDAALLFYRASLADVRAFRDVWRDRTAHVRNGSYDDDEVKRAWEHVSNFMRRLSSRLSESQTSSIRW